MSDDPRIPHNLRRYVVEQDYAQYTEVDHAVWRFVLLQTYQRLEHTAHPAYRQGLAQTGISVERIPRIPEMSACLERFGWHAVCVDGFIPPRAFQEFQAASILPIAADMRSKDHLVYTPAPDIIHEAAGHAPILPAPEYAAYLRAIGEVGKKAFSSPEDAQVYAAIFELSELKETRGAPLASVTAAEARLGHALSAVSYTSEASRLSRLYWWTAEYGLVGTPSDYRLYGAGLLSSLWESHACHDASVRKLPLSAACIEQGYDITRTQPQLFVARDFEQLFTVLAEVDATLSHRKGGDVALSAAVQSEELATLLFEQERFVTAERACASGSAKAGLLTLRGRVGFGARGQLTRVFDASEAGYHVPFGPLSHGQAPALAAPGTRISLRFAGGVELAGVLAEHSLDAHGQLASARLTDYHLSCAQSGLSERGAEYVWHVLPALVTAHAGALDPAFFPEVEASLVRVPKPQLLAARERALLGLYERAIAAFRTQLGSAAVPAFAAVHAELSRSFPDEWLLRWNLLECLCKLGEAAPNAGALGHTLRGELQALELKFAQREPIASGLRYLSSLAA